MATLQSLLATSLSPSQENLILHNAPHTISLLLSGSLLEVADEQTLHKFKLRVSGLIKSKLPIARWFGAYLAKVACSTNFAVVRGHGGTWAGLLIHILEIPAESPITHEIAIEALSTIFAQTWGKQELTRDITTPRLPQYIKLLLKLAEGVEARPLLPVIIPALNRVMKQQSTTFKPHAQRYERLLLKIIASSYTESYSVDGAVLAQVCEGYVLLHYATVKGNEHVVWRQSLIKVINEIHITVTQLASDVVEEDSSYFDPTNAEGLGIPAVTMDDGVGQINEKIRILFSLLSSFFTTGTKAEVKIPLGVLTNLADRLFSLNKHTMQKRGVEKATRSLFLAAVDDIHIATCSMLSNLISVVHTMILVHIEAFMHHVDVLSDTSNTSLLESLLKVASAFFKLIGVLPKAMVPLVSKLVQAAIKTIQPRIDPSSVSLPDAVANPSLFTVRPNLASVQTVTSFFSTVITTVPELSLPVRSQIDQFLIFAAVKPADQNSQAIQDTLALSAYYPGRTAKYSILPMAIRTVPTSNLLESMVHPRLPPVSSAVHNLEKSAILQPTKQVETLEENGTSTKRKLPEVDEPEQAPAPALGFSIKRAKSSDEMEVDTEETVSAPANLELKFEQTAAPSLEVKETKPPATTEAIESKPDEIPDQKQPTPEPKGPEHTAPVFTRHAKKPAPSETSNTSAGKPADLEDESDDEEMEIPGISLESSDDEE